MADFIEVKQGISVRADKITAIIDTYDKPDILCMVYTDSTSYPSVLPSSVIFDILNMADSKENDTQSQMLNIMKQQNTPMGG